MFDVMFERMLSWKGESFWPVFLDPGLLKDGSVVVETIQSILNILQRSLCDCWVPDKVTEIQKRGYSVDHIFRYIALNCRQPNLL